MLKSSPALPLALSVLHEMLLPPRHPPRPRCLATLSKWPARPCLARSAPPPSPFWRLPRAAPVSAGLCRQGFSRATRLGVRPSWPASHGPLRKAVGRSNARRRERGRSHIYRCATHTLQFLQTFKFAIFALNFLFCRFCRRGAPALHMCYRALHALRASRPARPSGAAPPSSGLPWAGGMGPDSPPRDWASTLPATRPPVASAEVM